MKLGAYSGKNGHAGPARRTFGLAWLGLPAHPGIALFFLSLALSHHWYDIVKYSLYDQLAAESLEAALLGLLATALCVALARRLGSGDQNAVLSRLSLTLLPGVLFLFAPFRYAQLCRWLDHCQYWSDQFMVAGVVLCALVGLYTWWERAAACLAAWASTVRAGLERTPSWWLFLVVWIACIALLTWRGHGRLAHPELFAEGGRQFVAGALNHGWESLGFAYAGYFHTVPRLIALLAVSIAPVAYIPVFTSVSSILIAGAVSAFIVRPGFRWLIPSDAVRIVAALLLCLIPGLREVLANLPNLHYLLFVLLGLLIVKDPDEPYRAWELILAVLIVLSSGMVAALAPVVLLRLWLKMSASGGPSGIAARLRGNGREIALAAIIVLPTVAAGLSVLLGGPPAADQSTASPLAGADPAAVLSAWATVLAGSLFLHPIGGTVAVTEIMSTLPLWVLAVAGLAVFAALFHRLAVAADRRQSAYVLAWLSACFVLLLLLALVRNADLEMFLLDRQWFFFKWWMRYHYVFAAAGVLLWLFLLRPTGLLPARRAGNVLALTLCVAYASQAEWYFDIAQYGEQRRWSRTSAELEQAIQTGCPRRVTVRIYPGNWKFTYYAARENPSCE